MKISRGKKLKAVWTLKLQDYSNYRVIIKEGQKVNANYTSKKCTLGAVYGFKGTTSMGHLVIYINIIKFSTLRFILRQILLN